MTALFLHVGGREVDGDLTRRHVEAGVLDRGEHTLLPLLDRALGQTDGRHGRKTGRRVDLYMDEVRVDAQYRRRVDAGQHSELPSLSSPRHTRAARSTDDQPARLGADLMPKAAEPA